jgi:hypothetical protein
VLDENANPDKYMEMLEAVTQGSTEAMAMLVQYAQDAAVESERLPEGLENAYSEGWVNISQE